MRHQWRANKSCQTPGTVLFLGVTGRRVQNADPDLRRDYVWDTGYAISGRYENGRLTRVRHHDGIQPDDLWLLVDGLLSRRRPVWVFGYDMSYILTLAGLWSQIDRGRYKLFDARDHTHLVRTMGPPKPTSNPILIDNDPPIVIVLEDSEKSKLILLDVRNWLPHFTVGETNAQDRAEMCGGIIGTYIDWIRKNNLGNFRWTAASQAMAAFRHSLHHTQPRGCPEKRKCLSARCDHLYHRLPWWDDDPEPRALERASYYGGEWRCFHVGKVEEPVYECDANSLFPSVMLSGLYPYRRLHHDTTQYTTAEYPHDPLASIARVRIETEDTYPLRMWTDGPVLHVSGSYDTVLAGAELKRGFLSDDIKCIYECCVYDCRDLFSKFVEYFWGLRQTYEASGDRLYAALAKAMLNSLYGKFGQRLPRWEYRGDVIPLKPWCRWTRIGPGPDERHLYRAIGYDVQEEVERAEKVTSIPSICAFVTAYAREAMRGMRSKVREGMVLYQACDCLYVDGPGYAELVQYGIVNSGKLGALKLDATYRNATFRGINNLQLDDRIICGPLGGEAIPVGDAKFATIVRERLSSVIVRPPDGTIREDSIVWDAVGQGPRGMILPCGRVQPYRVSMPPGHGAVSIPSVDCSTD